MARVEVVSFNRKNYNLLAPGGSLDGVGVYTFVDWAWGRFATSFL